MIVERNYIEKVYEEIEAEIREKFPNSIVLTLAILLDKVKAFDKYWFELEALGVKIGLTDDLEMVHNNTIRFTVPSSSEFETFDLDDDTNMVELSGVNMAKFIKHILLHVINNFMIRIDGVTIPDDSISFRFKEDDEKHVTVDTFNYITNTIDQFNKTVAPVIDQVQKMPKEDRAKTFERIKNTKTLNKYGIFFSGDLESFDASNIYSMKMDDFIQDINFKISVPSSSVYKFCDKEITGENVIEFIKSVFCNEAVIPPYLIDKNNITIRDEKWTSDKYSDQEAKAESWEKIYEDIFS